jgi:hypothetical protein
MLGGEAARPCKTLRHGTPGLVSVTGSAVAVRLSISMVQNNPALAKAMPPKRFVVRDMCSPASRLRCLQGKYSHVSQFAWPTIRTFIEPLRTRSAAVTGAC